MDSQTPGIAPQTPAPPAAVAGEVTAGGYAPSEPPTKKKMSAGAKWAIGLGVGFVLLTIVSCCGSVLLLSDTSGTISFGDGVCVIRIDGVIQGGSAGSGSPEYFIDQLDQALADTSVKAILLRIDSPGGTVAASQEIALAVKRASEEKPVVVSVGDICASGGYMVAAQADEIIASPGSSVGSIGVVMQIANVEGLLEKIGVDFITLHEGAFKDTGSPYRPMTEEETALLNEQLKLVHDQFVADVAEGREMSESDVREVATGWVWLGSEALDLGLVDSLGNYNDAVDRAAELGGIEGEPRIVSYEYIDPLAGFYEGLGIKSAADVIDADTLRRIALPR